MAKAVPPNDPQKLSASKGRPAGAGTPSTAAPLDEAQVAHIAERRRQAESLLASQRYEAAGQILLRLAKLPQEEVRETAAWARQELQRVRKQMGVPAEVTDSVALAPKSADAAPVAASSSTAESPPADSAARSESVTTDAGNPAGESLAVRLKGIATSPLGAIAGISFAAFLVGFLATAAAVRPPTATLVFEVEDAARGKEIGLGIDGRLFEVDSLELTRKVIPGRQTVAVTQGRTEWAALDLDLESGDVRTLRVVWRDGHPEVHLLGTDDSVLAKSLTPRPLPPPPPDKPAAPVVPLMPETKPAPKPASPGAGTPESNPSARTTSEPQNDAALATALFRKGGPGTFLSVQRREGRSVKVIGANKADQLPPPPYELMNATLVDGGAGEAEFALLKEARSLQGLILMGSEWTGDELKPLRGHPTMLHFMLRPRGSTFTTLKPTLVIPHLAECPGLLVINIESASISDDDLERLKEHRRLQNLSIVADAITSRGLPSLAKFPQLTSLHLRWMDPDIDGVTDEQIALLTGMPHLQSLTLEGGRRVTGSGFEKVEIPTLDNLSLRRFPTFNDEGIRAIVSRFPRLTQFNLNDWYSSQGTERVGSAVTNTTLETLAELRLLGRLIIHSAEGITDEGTTHVSRMTALNWLDLSGCMLGDAAVEPLAKLKLVNLNLSRTQVGDQSCKIIASMPQVVSLYLDNTLVTDEGVARLKSMKQLRQLSVHQTAVTREAVDALKAEIPMLNVIFGP
jgi:hypothetical protein